MNLLFVLNSAMLGLGLAMDAFCVSMSNGLICGRLGLADRLRIAGTYAFFQFLMPVVGWICVHTIAERFAVFHKMVPWIALLLLLYIGGKMLLEAWEIHQARKKEASPVSGSAGDQGKISREGGSKQDGCSGRIGWNVLFMQGIATSIDALSVGFTIVDYPASAALTASLIIAIVTLLVCLVGIQIGVFLGNVLEEKANILGGCILIFIGLEIFVKGVIL